MLSTSRPVGSLAVSDAGLARAFYVDALGLPVIEDGQRALVVSAGPISLRLVFVSRVAAPPYTVFGWEVPDISATMAGLQERGVVFLRFDTMDQDETGVWVSPAGHRIAWFNDPDGNVLSLTQTTSL